MFRKSFHIVLLSSAFAAGLCTSGAASAQDTASVITAAGDALRAGQADRAAALYSQALMAPDLSSAQRAKALIDRGLANQRLGNREEAVADFSTAITLNVLTPEDHARALLDRGITLDEMGKDEAAISDYSAALEAVPNFPAALNNRANTYRRRGDFNNAKRDYEASLASGNTTPEYPLMGLGQIAEAEGDKKAALGFYQEAYAANPNIDFVSQRVAALSIEAQASDADTTPPAARKPAAIGKPDAEPAPIRPPSAVKPQPHTALSSLQVTAARVPQSKAPPVEHLTLPKTGLRVQLGSYRDQASAADGWKHLAAATGELLHGLAPDIVKAEIAGKGTYYRLRTSPLPADRDANTLCQTLQARGHVCMVVKD